MPKLPSDRNAILNEQLYHDVFTKKGVKFLRIRRTADLSPLQGVEMEVAAEHVWIFGGLLVLLTRSLQMATLKLEMLFIFRQAHK